MKTKVISSNVDSITYEPITETLHVHYKSQKTYTYHKVRPELHDALLKAPSTTKFLSQYIHGKFRHTK